MKTLEKTKKTKTAEAPAPTRIPVAERLGIAEDDKKARKKLDKLLLSDLVITVAMYKGGVGKTELAKELAWLLDAVLVDFDWDGGNATRAWGYRHETRSNAPLLDALETGRIPRPLSGGAFRADLVPAHPDLGENQPEASYVTTQLDTWSRAWKRPIIVDTHPGGGPAAYGAIAAANITVVPVLLENRPLSALEGMADELRAFPLIVVPNRISSAPRAQVSRLQAISETYGIPVAPAIGNYSWLSQRQLRMAATARRPIPKSSRQFVDEITAVARFILDRAAKQQAQEASS